MNLTTLQILGLLHTYSYAILFPIAFVEGPAVSIVAGFLVATGFMMFLPTYVILISANILGDLVYYSIGHLVPRRKLNKLLAFLKVSDKKLESIERMFVRDRKKAILFGKLSHTIGSIFLIAAGIVKIPLTEYLGIGTVIEFPKAAILLLIGYYFGHSVTSLNKAVDITLFGFLAFTVIFVLLYFIIGKVSDKEVEKLEK